MDPSVCVLDYGSGNVKSVTTMISMLTKNVVVSNLEIDIRRASHLILPGVGAFGAAMEKIRRLLPLEVLREQVFEHRKPFLGICVGMQVLADQGHEFGVHEGLGWIPGTVRQLATPHRLPHIGWNNVNFRAGERLAAGFDSEIDCYFVHSFAFTPTDPEVVIATTEYGVDYCTAVRRDNIVGVQFHPEKSQHVGKQLLSSFLISEAADAQETRHSRITA